MKGSEDRGPGSEELCEVVDWLVREMGGGAELLVNELGLIRVQVQDPCDPTLRLVLLYHQIYRIFMSHRSHVWGNKHCHPREFFRVPTRSSEVV